MPVNSFSDHPLSWTPPLDAVKARPVYLALAATLEEDIASGKLPAGTKLPPQRELADFLDLDFTTVTRAYDLCRSKGLIHGVTGRGTFVSSATRDNTVEDVVDCAVVQGFPEAGAAEIAAAARAVLSRASAERLFSYHDRDGSPSALAAGVKWLEMCGADTIPDRTAVFPGAQGAISSVLLSLFHPGDAIAVDGFTYANFISLARLAHLKLIAVPSDENGMIPLALSEAADKKKVKGVFLMPRDANPTGITLSEKRKNEIANTVLAKNLLLIEDDARLLPPLCGEKTLFARAPEQTVYIAGSTRNIAPGLRATFMAFPGHCTGRILNALHHLTIKAGALDTEILAELILSGRAMRILKAKAKKAFAANKLFDEIFPSAPKASPTALFRVLPFPGTSGRGQETEAAYRAAGVDVCHSDRFSVKPGQPDSFLRVSLSSATSQSRLRRGLKVLAKV